MRIEDTDDLWYLSHLVDPGDTVKGTATRKVRIGDGENAKVTKKKVTLSIEAEKVEYLPENGIVRINGKILEGPEDFPKGSYQNISLGEGGEFSIKKVNWPKYQKEKLKESAEKSYTFLICVFDREEVLFALSQKFGFKILAKVKSDLPKKGDVDAKKSTFYQDIIKGVETYASRHHPENIIVASPAFYKEDLYKLIKDDTLKKKITLATCSSAKNVALDEIMKRPELKEILKQSRNRQESLLVAELLKEISKEGLAVYGKKEVKIAIDSGAISKLICTDKFIYTEKEAENYQELDEQLKSVDNLKGDVHIISSDHESGKKIDGLGGIAGITRYKL